MSANTIKKPSRVMPSGQRRLHVVLDLSGAGNPPKLRQSRAKADLGTAPKHEGSIARLPICAAIVTQFLIQFGATSHPVRVLLAIAGVPTPTPSDAPFAVTRELAWVC